ncbi:AAA-like domain-containing protein [Brasilonema sp. CT11]|nr:AAA-like domain-containing protein [Brasilonema sp. CT11]
MRWDLIKTCTVAISTPEGEIRGTGFFISSEGYLLTCAHVVEDVGGWDQVRVNGEAVELIYLGDRTSDDFAVLRLSSYQGASIPLSLDFQPMDRFLSIGYGRPDFPQGASIDGTITDINRHSEFGNLSMLRLRVEANSQQVQGGYSGSPVFNAANQRVIGIIAAYDNTEGALAVPLVTVQERWSDLEKWLNPSYSDEDFPFFDSTFYSNCYRELNKQGALIRVKAPLQWGKTYLIKNILDYATKQGYKAVRVDFQEPETTIFDSLENFLQWFCIKIAEELNLSDSLPESRQSPLGANSRCTNFFEKFLLPAINSPLVLGLDNLDWIFTYEQITRNFLPLLRTWHEKATTSIISRNLRLVIAYSKEDFIPIDRNHSPFNVGLEVSIPELSQVQVKNLLHHYQLSLSEEQFQQLGAMMNGHPYLIRVALKTMALHELTLTRLLEIAPTEEGLYRTHLLRLWSMLQENPGLLEAMRSIVAANIPVRIDAEKASKLRDMGLVKYVGSSVQPLCNLYRLYFRDRFGMQ